LANSKPKRQRPKTKLDRARLCQINTLLNNSRTPDAQRAELEDERDRLSPVIELTRPDLEAWLGRIKAARENGSLSGVVGEKEEATSDGSPVSPHSKSAEAEKDFVQNRNEHLAALVPGTYEHDAAIAWRSIPATPEVREAAVKRYWTEHDKRETERLLADPVRRRKNAALYVATTTDNPLRDHARKFADGLNYDENNTGTWTSVAERREHAFSRLLWEVLTWNRSFAHPHTDPKWSADIFAEVDRRDSEDAEWFRHVLETPPQPLPAEAKTEPTKPAVVSADNGSEPGEKRAASAITEPVLDPVVRRSANLAARAALVLRTDSWLSTLADQSPEMRTKILASLSQELLRVGFVNGDFAMRLYNDRRPKALSQFPPRQF
jgi:hypothetical protein